MSASPKIFNMIQQVITEWQKLFNSLSQQQGAWSWLITLPIKQKGYDMTKQLFWDLVRMAYNCELSRLPSVCECSMKFDLTQGRKKRNRFAKTLKWSRFCSSYRGKASSNIQLEGTRFDLIYALDGFGKCFWSEGFNPNAVRSVKLELSKSKEINEKKRRSITMNV